MKKISILIGGVVIVGVLIASFRGFRVERYKDENVIGGEIVRPWNLVSVHSSTSKYLIVLGQKFEGIRGLPPYYILVSQSAGIAFVTDDGKSGVSVHFANLGEKKIVSLNIGDSIFGWNIGVDRKPSEKYTDWIEVLNANELKLVTRTDDIRVETTINILKCHVEHIETVHLR